MIDTSTRVGRVGLARGEDMALCANLNASHGHARDLTMAIRKLLADCDVTARQIDAIAVNIGPGSFTGIRVGLAAAKAMTYALGLKLIAVDVFDVIARRHTSTDADFHVVVDFQLNSMLGVEFGKVGADKWERGAVRQLGPDRIPEFVAKNVLIAGPGVQTLKKRFANVRALDEPPHGSRLEELRLVATDRWREKRFDDPFVVEPFYARPSSAEVTWDARHAVSG